jgi:hypothetical protein
MYLLEHIRKDHTNFNQEQFAQAINGMHGFDQPVTKEMIADLENPMSKVKYPVVLLQELALYCTRVASVGHSRLVEYQDIVSLRDRALSPDESIGWQWHDPQVYSGSAPALPAAE